MDTHGRQHELDLGPRIALANLFILRAADRDDGIHVGERAQFQLLVELIDLASTSH